MGNRAFHSTEEAGLVKAALNGDSNCLSELYQRYYPKVVSRCFSFVKDKASADDLAQDVLLKAFEKLSSFQRQSSFATWLYAIASNHCLDFLRKKKQHPCVPLDEQMQLSADEADLQAQLRLGLLEKKLHCLLKQLSQEERNLLISKYCHDKSIQELQLIHHLSSSAIKMRLKRSKEKLSRLLLKTHPCKK